MSAPLLAQVPGAAPGEGPSAAPTGVTSALPVPPAPPAAAAGTEEPDARRPISLLEVVQRTLKNHPSIQAARGEVQLREALLLATKSPFDTFFTANAGHTHEAVPVLPAQALVPAHDSNLSDTTSLGLGASWAGSWGTLIRPSIGIDRIHQRPGNSLVIPGLPSDPFHQARVDLTVIQPLLRGAGRLGTSSAVDAAGFAREAANHLIAHTAQQQVFLAVAAYWQLVAAQEFVGLLAATEAGAKKLVADTQRLVEADQRPRSDLRQLEGNLANRTRELIEARNGELRAFLVLQEAMGQSAGIETLHASESFPKATDAGPDANTTIQGARQARRDLKALQSAVQAGQAQLAGARKNTQPALDLSVSVGYNAALDEDGVGAFVTTPASNIPGISGGIGLSLELPIQNTARRAERDLRAAELSQATLQLTDLDRRLPIDVMDALNDLRLSLAALEASTRAVEQYQAALVDEQDRLREGLGTVIDVVLTQEQLIRAQQNRTSDHARYAVAAARLRFEVGVLPSAESDAARAVAELLGPLPAASRGTDDGAK